MADQVAERELKSQMSENHHVHFTDSDDLPANDEIVVEKLENSHFKVHLGFLQHLHRYVLTFTVPAEDFSENLEVVEDAVPSVNSKLISVKQVDKGLIFEVEFFAHKDKLLKEKLTLKDGVKNASLILDLNARVLGHGKGTPMLKDGVHCLSVERNDDDDGANSDWQGF
ncbi:unnamed protein product [Notodromas monacha]|uniref:Adipose-secreted signaling protein n=1 Tax=Notodromas monacha TaxID=399045 RepID=A0A7R9GAW9_9CRUS|nr:unnamed protein product [Notodromas monacha]CAG0914435.1 unnamed protein product [Notodromas monacha]